MHFIGKGLNDRFKPKHLFQNNKTSLLFANTESGVVLRSTSNLETKSNNKLLNQDLISILRLLLVETGSPQQGFIKKPKLEMAFNANVKSQINPQSLGNQNKKLNFSGVETNQQNISLQTLKPLNFVQNIIYKSVSTLAYPQTVEANQSSIREFNPNLTSIEFAKAKSLNSKFSFIATKKGTPHDVEFPRVAWQRDKTPSQASLTYLNYYYFQDNIDLGLHSNKLGRAEEKSFVAKTKQQNSKEFQHWVVKPKNSGIIGTQPSGFIQKRSFLSYWIIPFVGFYTLVVSVGTSSGGFASATQHSFVAEATAENLLSRENNIISLRDPNNVSEPNFVNSTELPLEKIWFTSQTNVPYFGKQADFSAAGEALAVKTKYNQNMVIEINSSDFAKKELAQLTTTYLEAKKIPSSAARVISTLTTVSTLPTDFFKKYKMTKSCFGFLASSPYWNQLNQSTEYKLLNQDGSTLFGFKESLKPLPCKYLYSLKTTFFKNVIGSSLRNGLQARKAYKPEVLAQPSLLGFRNEQGQPTNAYFTDSIEKMKTSVFSFSQGINKLDLNLISKDKPTLLKASQNFTVTSQTSWLSPLETELKAFTTGKGDLQRPLLQTHSRSGFGKSKSLNKIKQNQQDQFILISGSFSKNGFLTSKVKGLGTEVSVNQSLLSEGLDLQSGLGLQAEIVNPKGQGFVKSLNLTPVTNSKNINKFLENLTTTYNWDLAKDVYNLSPKVNSLGLQAGLQATRENLMHVNPEASEGLVTQQVNLQNLTLKQSFKSSIADNVKTSYIINLLKSKTNGEASPATGIGTVSNLKNRQSNSRLSRAFKTKSDSIYCFLSLNKKTISVKESISNVGFASAPGHQLPTDSNVLKQVNDFAPLSPFNLGTYNARPSNPNIIKLQTPIFTASRFKKVTTGNSLPIVTQPIITNYTMRNNLGLQTGFENPTLVHSKADFKKSLNFLPLVNQDLTPKKPYYTSNSFNNYLSYIQYKLTNFISIKTTHLFSAAQNNSGFVDKDNLKSSILSVNSILKNYVPTKNSFVVLKQKSESQKTSSVFLKPLNMTKNLRIVLEHKKMFVRKNLLNDLSLKKIFLEGKEFAFETSRYSNSLAQEPLLALNRPAEQGKISTQNFETIAENSLFLKTKQELQKKRKARKQRLESRRQKKRKRFYPRPTWLRLRLSKIGQFSNKTRVLQNQTINPLAVSFGNGVGSQSYNNIQDFVYNLQKSKELKKLNKVLKNNPSNLALARMRSSAFKRYLNAQVTTQPNTLPFIDFRSKAFPCFAERINFAQQIPAAFRIQTNSHKENIFANLLQNSKKLKPLNSTLTKPNNINALDSELAQQRNNLNYPNNMKINKNLYTEYLYNNKLFIGKKIIMELKNTNGKNYVTFEAKSTNPPPNSNKTNNNSFRDFWIWLYDLTSTNNWNKNLALNNIIPNLPIPIQNVKFKPITDFAGGFTEKGEKLTDQSQKLARPGGKANVNQGKNNPSFSLLHKTPKKNIQFRTNANFRSLNWALNKTNLWASSTQRLNLWSTQKLRNQSKNNKTKYLEKQIQSTINSGFSSLYLKSFLTKNNNNFYKFKISKKLHNKEHKLAYLESSFYNQHTKGQDVKNSLKHPFSAQRNPVNRAGLQPLVAKPTLNLAWWAGLDMSWLNLTNTPLGGESFISPSNLEQDLNTRSAAKFNSTVAANSIQGNQNTLTELTFIFAMHFCALISLLSISQIRSFIKFHLILIHKLSNGYLQVIYKNFNLTTVKAFNFFNSSTFQNSFAVPYAAREDKAISALLKQNRKLLKFGFAQQKRLLAPQLNNNFFINSRSAGRSNISAFGKSKINRAAEYPNTRLLSSRKSLILKQSLTKANTFNLAKPTVLKAIYEFASGFKGKHGTFSLNAQTPYRETEIRMDKPIYSVYSSLKSLSSFRQTNPIKESSEQQLNNPTIANSTKRLPFISLEASLVNPGGLPGQQRLFTKRNTFSKNLETFKTETLAYNKVVSLYPSGSNSFNSKKPTIDLTSLGTFIKFFQQLLLFIKYKKANQLPASKNITTKAINVNSLSSQILLTEVTSQTIQNIQKTTLNTSYKIVDTFEYFLRIIYSFFEKPSELTMDWIAYAFLVEWSSDFLTFTPEKGEKQIWLAFSKWARHTKISNTFTSNSILTATLNLTLGQFLYKRVLYLNDQLIEIINRPDTDLMNRQKKGTLFWDIWSDVLIKAADKYNINVPSLSNIKEEQNLLIDKFLGDNLDTTKRLPSIKNREYKLTPKALAFNNVKSNTTGLSKLQETIYGVAKLKPQGLIGLNNTLGEFSPAGGIKSRHTSINLKGSGFTNLDSISNFELLKKSTQDINQFVTYQSKETDLFLDYHPPKSFSHISAIRYYTLVQQPLGTLVCQIYSGLLTKQIAKNVLVIGSTLSSNTNTALERTQKTLLIQALAGETEIKIITDNASRYAVVNRGFAVGIKLLKDVFEAITLNTPCLFLLEDIHLIGERRPLLISDTGADSGSGDELSKATENTFGAQRNGEAVHEKNQVLYQLNRHGITHYKKPFKGDFSLSIPTNHFAFDLFLKSRYTNYSSTPTHPFAYSLGSLDMDKISGANNPGQNTQTAEFSLTNKLQKLTSKRSSSSSNFETTNTGQFLASSLQFGLNSLNKLLSPPSTSPFTVLLLKEQKKLKPKRIVKELPWVGLSSSEQQLGLAPAARVSYSVRAKIAALADLGFTNMSAKLDMITDLLVIIDSVRGNRGFVVFATTHLPHTLDPALRRPGRLDETISIPTLSNIWTRWEFTKGTQPIFTNVFALEKVYPSAERNRTIVQSNNKMGLFSPSAFPCFAGQIQSKGVQQLLNNYAYSNQNLVKYYGSIDKLDFINLDFVSNNNNNVLSSIVNGYKQLAFNQNLKTPKAELLNLNERNTGLEILNSTTLRNLKTKQLNTNSGNFAFNNGKSIYTIPNTKRIQQMGQIAYHQIGKKIITNKYSFNLSSLTSIYNNPTTYESTLALTETSEYLQNQSQYSSLYSSPEFIKKTLVCLLSGKLSEQFAVSNFALTLTPRTVLTNNGQTSNPFKAAQNRKNFLCATLYGIDQTWRAATSLALSFVQKRYLYNKNLIIPKLMNFTNYTPLEEAPSPPTSNILIPAKRYENAKKALKENIEHKVTRSIQEKLEAHTKQSYIQSIYQKNKNLLSPNTNKQSNIAERTALISLETSKNPLTQITSSYVVYENKIVKRHRNYLTNQWWNGQLTEHSSETLFLSDIDWRYTFIDNLNNPTLSQNKNLFFNKLHSCSAYSSNAFASGTKANLEILNGVKNQTKELIKAPIQSQDIVIDFPDADQSYNPKNRRWILTSGDWDSWFNFDKKLQTEIFQHLISECIVQSYILFDQNRELLDYAAAKYMKKGLLKNQNLTVAFKKFT